MNIQGWAEIAVTLGLAVALGFPLGLYMARVWAGRVTWLKPVERVFYRAAGIDPDKGQGWLAYTVSLLAFSGAAFCSSTPSCGCRTSCRSTRGFAGLTPHLAFNTAISFVTNTNWQFYSGESAAGHLPRWPA